MVAIYTHSGVDLDATASVWAVRKYKPGFEWALILFRHQSWDGSGMDHGDMAVDIRAGGRGIKGEQEADGTTHSSFATIMKMFAPKEDREALRSVIDFIDAQDAYGSAVRHLVPGIDNQTHETLSCTSLGGIFRAMQTQSRDDLETMNKVFPIFDGLLFLGKKRIKGKQVAEKAELFADGKVALVETKEHSATYNLFDRGVQVVVSKNGHNLGVIRSQSAKLRVDRPEFVRVIEEAGEKLGEKADEWFAHASGFLLRRGSRSQPATKPSAVSAEELVGVAVKLLASSTKA